MAKITFKASAAYSSFLGRYQDAIEHSQILERAVASGAAIVADRIRSNLEDLPEDTFRRLPSSKTFSGVPAGQKRDLADSFGLTPIKRDADGNLNTKAGFDGYGSFPTPTYPNGIPNQLLARTVESGSSVRAKTPFVRPAVDRTRSKAVAAMQKIIDKETESLHRR